MLTSCAPRGLQLAEAKGISAPFGCRLGACGTCSAKVICGKVAYPSGNPRASLDPQSALLCQAVPAKADNPEDVLQIEL